MYFKKVLNIFRESRILKKCISLLIDEFSEMISCGIFGPASIRFQVAQGVLRAAMKPVRTTNSTGKRTAPVIRLGNLTARLLVQTLIFGVGTFLSLHNSRR